MNDMVIRRIPTKGRYPYFESDSEDDGDDEERLIPHRKASFVLPARYHVRGDLAMLVVSPQLPDPARARAASPNRSIVDLAKLIIPGAMSGKSLALFAAYFDESGTHKGSKWLAVGGFVADVEHWVQFEADWQNVLSNHQMTHLHTKDIANSSKRDLFIQDFRDALARFPVAGFVTVIDPSLYRAVFPPGEPGRIRDSAYGVCFRISAANILEKVRKETGQPLAFILEDGGPNRGDVLRIYQNLKAAEDERGWSIDGIAFADKKRFGALQAADFATYTTAKSVGPFLAGGPLVGMLAQVLATGRTSFEVFILDRAEILELRAVADDAYQSFKEFGRRKTIRPSSS